MVQSRPAPSLEREILPIDEHKDTILHHIKGDRVTIVQGDTGCGKSSRLPLILLEHAATSNPPLPCRIMVRIALRCIFSGDLVEILIYTVMCCVSLTSSLSFSLSFSSLPVVSSLLSFVVSFPPYLSSILPAFPSFFFFAIHHRYLSLDA